MFILQASPSKYKQTKNALRGTLIWRNKLITITYLLPFLSLNDQTHSQVHHVACANSELRVGWLEKWLKFWRDSKVLSINCPNQKFKLSRPSVHVRVCLCIWIWKWRYISFMIIVALIGIIILLLLFISWLGIDIILLSRTKTKPISG